MRPGFLESLRNLGGKVGALEDIVNTIEPARSLRLLEAKNVAEEARQIDQRLKADLTIFQGLFEPIRGLIFDAARPRGNKVAPSREWRARDTLHGSSTGPFVRALVERLEQRQDLRFTAFARGSVVGYAAALCGSAFLNAVVGAPYRNEWWRHRWIGCHVDCWAWGMYALRRGGRAVPFASDVPTPTYEFWPEIRGAKLHERLTIGGITADAVLNAIKNSAAAPAVLPQALIDDWLGAYRQAYGVPVPGTGIDAAGLQSAYALLWLVLWLQTSGEALPVVRPRENSGPKNCGEMPEWVAVDGSVIIGGQTLQPAPQPVNLPNKKTTICAITWAILGGLGLLLGFTAGGWLMITHALDEVAPDWDKVRCHIDWLKVLMNNFTNEVHRLLEANGLGYPYASSLKHNAINLNAGADPPDDAAIITARVPRQNRIGVDFPAPVWFAPGASPPARLWPKAPTGLEAPRQVDYADVRVWPTHFIDGLEPPFAFANDPNPPPPQQRNPMTPTQSGVPLVRDAGVFAQRRQHVHEAQTNNRQFGNAVDVALELLARPPAELLSWDLDNDRGCAFPTWRRPSDSAAMNQIVPE
jgi:hypothetical protein